MKALLLSNLFPSSAEPTRGTFNKQIFTSLSQHCEARVISPRAFWSYRSTPGLLFSTKKEIISGITAYFPAYWTIPRVLPEVHGNAMYYSLHHYIRRLRKEFAFDVILAAWAYPDAFSAVKLGFDFDCPVVTNLMGSDINELGTYPGIRPQIQWTLANSFRTIAVSHALKNQVIQMGIAPEKILVRHNGVNGELFQIRNKIESRSKLNLAQDRRYILYIGNILPVKGTDILIESMRVFTEKDKNTDLLVVGSGPLKETLIRRVHQLGLSDRVLFFDRQLHSEIPYWMSAADVFCLPSRNEGCPNVILEALASGCPVVASRVGGIPELVNNSNGILFPSEDPSSLANALHNALQIDWDSESLRNSVEYLSWDAVAESYLEVLKSAIS